MRVIRSARFPNPVKFPHGIAQLVKEVNALGCRFGMWFEPEMISEESVCVLLPIR
jgi:alpha-galactosidase